MALALIAMSLPALWLPWLITGFGNDGQIVNAFGFLPLGLFVCSTTIGVTIAMGYTSFRPTGFRPTRNLPLVLTAGAIAALPGVLMISAVEFAQSLVPGWLTPVLTNSAVLTLRAGTGVWVHTGLLVAGLALWVAAPSMMTDNELTSPRRAKGRLLLLLVVIAIPILRSLPLFTLTVNRGDETASGSRLAVVHIVPGEVPLLGVLSTIAMLIFLALALTSVLRPEPLLLIGASIGLGFHLGIIWLQVVVVSLASGVIPDSWSAMFQGWAAVDLAVRPTALTTLAVSAVGFLAVLLAVSGSLTLQSAHPHQPLIELQDDLP
jgi:hypothetical protein